MFLRQSTQKSIQTPPLVDDTDFKTAETVAFNADGIAVSVIQADGTVVPATPAENPGDWYWVHKSTGSHWFTLKATDVAQLGPLRVQGSATGVLLWWRDFYVLSAQVYDSLFRMTETLDLLDANAGQIGGATATLNAIADALLARTGITAGGAVTFGQIQKIMYAMLRGKATRSGLVTTIYDDDGTTPLLTITMSSTERTPA